MKTSKIKWLIGVAFALLIIGGLAFIITSDMRAYNKAIKLERASDYQQAASIYETIVTYKDAKDHLDVCNYQVALIFESDGSYTEAATLFEKLGDYSNSHDHLLYCHYQLALDLESTKEYAKAQEAFESLGKYSDSDVHVLFCKYQQAIEAEENSSATKALEMFTAIEEYSDSAAHIRVLKEFISAFDTEYQRLSAQQEELSIAINHGNELLEVKAPALDMSLDEVLKDNITTAKDKQIDLSGFNPITLDEYKQYVPELQAIDITSYITEINDAAKALETSRKQFELVNVPTEEYVIACLSKVNNIATIAPATEDHDPNNMLGKAGSYIAQIYFSSSLLNQQAAYISAYDLIEEGTSAGGSIEIYNTADEAKKREAYLATFDGSLLSSGSHKVIGTIIIRTSPDLTASQQKQLESDIISALTDLGS